MPLDESPLQSEPAAPPVALPPRVLPVEFRGTTREYFGVWLFNLLLTLLTFGVWSAWAKVRRKRFFLGSTFLDGDAFDYHARGGQILKGRILAVIYLLVLNFGTDFVHPYVYYGLSVALLLVLPWIINMSLRFNARMTSWRNVRFDFQGSYWQGLIGFVLLPLVGTLTLGLLYPFATRYASRYVARSHRFGTAPFAAAPRVGPIYAAWGLASLITLAALAAIAAAMLAASGYSLQMLPTAMLYDPRIIWFATLAILVAFYVGGLFYGARVRNVTVGSMTLDGAHRFGSVLSGLQLIWITITNLAATVASAGLLRPWAVVRQYRYQCACLAALAADDLGGFASAFRPAGGAFGSEVAEFEGIDIGF